jgi:hypothetical protein
MPAHYQFVPGNASAAHGLDPRQVPLIGHYLFEAGGRNVSMKYYDIPIGAWGRRIGLMMQMNLLNAFGGLQALYCEHGATAEEFMNLLNQLPEEWSSWHPYIRLFIWNMQKM